MVVNDASILVRSYLLDYKIEREISKYRNFMENPAGISKSGFFKLWCECNGDACEG